MEAEPLLELLPLELLELELDEELLLELELLPELELLLELLLELELLPLELLLTPLGWLASFELETAFAGAPASMTSTPPQPVKTADAKQAATIVIFLKQRVCHIHKRLHRE